MHTFYGDDPYEGPAFFCRALLQFRNQEVVAYFGPITSRVPHLPGHFVNAFTLLDAFQIQVTDWTRILRTLNPLVVQHASVRASARVGCYGSYCQIKLLVPKMQLTTYTRS